MRPVAADVKGTWHLHKAREGGPVARVKAKRIAARLADVDSRVLSGICFSLRVSGRRLKKKKRQFHLFLIVISFLTFPGPGFSVD